MQKAKYLGNNEISLVDGMGEKISITPKQAQGLQPNQEVSVTLDANGQVKELK